MTTNFTVTNETELNAEIRAIDVSGADAAQNTNYVINITGTIDLTTDLLAINLESGSSLTIGGTNGSGGAALDGGGSQRGLFVYAGNVTVENLTIENMSAVGGAGASGGGGGAGLGGGLFVTGTSDGVGGAHVTLDDVTFTNDKATGGAGGAGGYRRRRRRRRRSWRRRRRQFRGLSFGGGGGGGIGSGATGGVTGLDPGAPGSFRAPPVVAMAVYFSNWHWRQRWGSGGGGGGGSGIRRYGDGGGGGGAASAAHRLRQA